MVMANLPSSNLNFMVRQSEVHYSFYTTVNSQENIDSENCINP